MDEARLEMSYDARGLQTEWRRYADAAGTQQIGRTTFSYDHRNRLTRVERHSSGGILLSEATFVYDVFDRRIGQIVDADGAGPAASEETWTVYDGEHAWADFDAAGNVLARYLYTETIDEIVARYRPGEGTSWYLTDRLGTVRDIVDAAGAVTNHIDYDSFGRVLLESNAAAGDRFKFTGREYDPQLELYYYRARFYDPLLGRFISQDPLGFAAGDANLYRYVGNDPLNYTDPFGLSEAAERGIWQSLITAPLTVKSWTECFSLHFAASGIPTIAINAGLGWWRGATESETVGDILWDLSVDAVVAAIACSTTRLGSVSLMPKAGFAALATELEALTVLRHGLTTGVVVSATFALANEVEYIASKTIFTYSTGNGGGGPSGPGGSPGKGLPPSPTSPAPKGIGPNDMIPDGISFDIANPKFRQFKSGDDILEYTLEGGEVTVDWVSGKGASSMMKFWMRMEPE